MGLVVLPGWGGEYLKGGLAAFQEALHGSGQPHPRPTAGLPRHHTCERRARGHVSSRPQPRPPLRAATGFRAGGRSRNSRT